MALLDISLVTQALTNLIQFSFKASDIWNPAGTCNSPQVSPQSPDKLVTESVGVYLYHIMEESQYKNLRPPGNDIPPVRYVPISLSLFFQVTAFSNIQTDQARLNEQKMMGIAIKALHDYPIIDDNTEIIDLQGNKNRIFPLELCDNKNQFRISLLPVDHFEAISFWTTSSSPLRLAVYYQVSVLMNN
jgi:hypothetical protein